MRETQSELEEKRKRGKRGVKERGVEERRERSRKRGERSGLRFERVLPNKAFSIPGQ